MESISHSFHHYLHSSKISEHTQKINPTRLQPSNLTTFTYDSTYLSHTCTNTPLHYANFSQICMHNYHNHKQRNKFVAFPFTSNFPTKKYHSCHNYDPTTATPLHLLLQHSSWKSLQTGPTRTSQKTTFFGAQCNRKQWPTRIAQTQNLSDRWEDEMQR